MTGSFDSKEQADFDTNFIIFIFTWFTFGAIRTDADWLYVEQAASWTLEKPYRQRVYRVEHQ